MSGPVVRRFADIREASEAASMRSFSGVHQVHFHGVGWCLKRPGARLGVEPTYLCSDGRWRKYDRIADLPHSTAGGGVT